MVRVLYFMVARFIGGIKVFSFAVSSLITSVATLISSQSLAIVLVFNIQ